MPLLGGACKFAGAPAPAGDPRFVGDPYSVFAFHVYGFGGPKKVYAGFEIDADGAIEKITQDGNDGDVGRWDNNIGTLNKADYEFRFDGSDTFKDPNSDDFNVWIPANAGLDYFGLAIFGNGDHTVNGTIRVRDATTLVEYDSASMSMTVAQEP